GPEEPCEEEQITEQLCDVVASTGGVPLTGMTFEDRSVNLSNDVTVSNDLGLWRMVYYSAMMKGTPNTFRFNTPVDIDFGITSNDMYGIEFSYSSDVEPYWVNQVEVLNTATNTTEKMVTVDTQARTVRVINFYTGYIDMVSGGESESLVKFRGDGITEFTLTVLDYCAETGDYTDAGITYMDVTANSNQPFQRTSTVDCNGTVTSFTDTLNGASYVVKGTVGPCDEVPPSDPEEPCAEEQITEQLCDVDAQAASLPRNPMHPNEDRSRLLTNGVTVTPNDGLWLGEARGLVLFHSVSTS